MAPDFTFVYQAIKRSKNAEDVYQALLDVNQVPLDLLRKAKIDMNKAFDDYRAAYGRFQNENMS
jgi:hypothetical protein